MTHEILARLGLDTQDFNQGVESASGSMSNLGNVAMAGLGLAAGAVGGAILGIGAAAWEVGTEVDSASRQMAASLGMTLDESEHLKDAMLDVWGQGLNSSIEETGAAITIVSQSMKSLADDDIANATASALKLQGVFEDADLERSTSAANSLMKEFGLTSEEAFDYLAGGYQKGLNSSGDFLDSINEYGVLFDQAGFTADEMFSIMETGLQAGALGTDKIADGIKEFGIRVQELSDDQLNTLKYLGIDSKAFYDGMIDGSLSVADAYKMVADGLAEIENPIHRNSAGVKFFGAAWEDMGAEAFLATSTATTSLGDLSGSMDALNVRYEDFSGIAERLKRRFLVGLLPMRDSLLSLANEAMPYVESAFGWFENNLPAIFNTASQAISLLGAGDLEGLANLWADVGPKVEAFAIQIYTWIESTKEILKEKFMTWGQAVTGWLIENSPLLIQAAQNLTSTLIDFIIAKAFEIQTSFLGWGQAAVGWLVTSAPSIIVKAEEFYIGLFTWVGSKAIELHTRFLEWGQGLVGWLITSAPDMLVKAEEIGISLLTWVSSKAIELQVRFLEWGYAVVAWIAPSASDMLIQVETLGVNFLNWISVKAVEITAGFVTWAQSLIAWIGPAAVDFLAKWPLMLYDFLTWIEQSAAPILLQLGDWALSFIEWVAPMIPDLLIGLGAVTLALTAFIVETAVVLGVKLVEWAAAFVGWIATEAVPRLWDALQAMEDALFEWVDWGVSWLLEQGKNLGSSLLDGILSMLQNAGGTIGALLEEAIWAGVNQIKNTFKIWSPSRVFADEIGAPIVEGVAQGIFKKSNVVKESLNDAINDAIDSPGLFLDYFSYMMKEGKYLDDSLATSPPSLSASMEEIGHALVPTGEVYKGLTSYLDGVMGDGDYLNDYLSEMPFSIKSSVQAIGEALAIDPSSHEALLEYLSVTLKEGDYLNDYLADLPDALKPAAEIIGKNLGYGGDIYKDLSNYLAAVNQDGELLNVHLEQLPKSIQASAQAMGQFLSSKAATMTSSMDSALPELAVTFSENASADAIQELDSYFEGWVGEEKEWLIEQGNELGDALLGGILVILKNAGGIIAEVLTQSIENALAQVKATYGIASPSRVFADEIGAPIVEGVAQGIFKKGQVVEDSLNDVIGGAAADSVNDIQNIIEHMVKYGENLDDLYGDLPDSIIPFMDTIEDFLVNGGGETYYHLSKYLKGIMKDGDHLNDYLSRMPNHLKESVQAIGESLALDPSNYQALSDYLLGAIEGEGYLNDSLVNLPDTLKPAAQAIGHYLNNAGNNYKNLSDYLDVVSESGELLNVHFEQLPKHLQISAQALGQFLSSEAATMTSSMDSALPEMAVTFSENASADAIQELDSYFEGWVGEEKEWLIEQGNELGDALLGGILVILENAGGIIAEVLTQSIENALAQVKATYGIASPSRVFADEIGSPLAQGIASGVSGGQVAIADAVTSSIDYGKSLASFPKQTDNKVKEAKASNSQQTNTITVHVTAEAGREQIAAQAVGLELDNALMRARARGLNA